MSLRNLNCPLCGNPMDIRIKIAEHINQASKVLKKQKYYQYYCDQCDDDKAGWTSTESDTESLKL